MAIIQPLYYPGGKYKPSDDRKLLAALVGTESDGNKTNGVIGGPDLGTRGMKVAASTGLGITVQPGMCIASDAVSASIDADTPAVYLAGIDTEALTVTLPTAGTVGGRTDLIYAKIDTAPVLVQTATRSGDTVTLSTGTTAHGFLVGDTVVVTGLDDVFNGTYTAISPTSGTTITYTSATSGTINTVTYTATVQRIDSQGNTLGIPINITNREFSQAATPANGVTPTAGSSGYGFAKLTTASSHSIAVGDTFRVSGLSSVLDGDYVAWNGTASSTIYYFRSWNGTAVAVLGSPTTQYSANAQVRVPFAIRQATSTTTLPTNVTGVPLATVIVYAASLGTVTDKRNFVSAAGGVHYYDSTAGGSTNANRPAHSEGKLIYDISANKMYYSDGSSWKEVSVSGHTHDTVYAPAVQASSTTLASPVSSSQAFFSTLTGSSYTTARALDPSVTVNFTCVAACYVLVEYSMFVGSSTSSDIVQADVQLTGATTYSALGVTSSSTNGTSATDGTAMSSADYLYHSNAAYGSGSGSHRGSKLYKLSAGTTTLTLFVKINNSADSVAIESASLRVIPLYNA